MLKNKNILLGVTGGIAAFKAVELASILTKAGAKVKTIMTKNACEFVTPLTFRSLTHQSVSTELFNNDAPIEHISLADWADLIVIAPASANFIGKVVSGIADDLLTTTVMAAQCTKLIVPAMNVHMYENPIVQKNIGMMKELGYQILEADTGKLACGYIGKGRFPAIEEIIANAEVLMYNAESLQGLRVLISAGAAKEVIDPMRYITNVSSGKMGVSLARASHFRGAEVTLVHSLMQEKIPYYTSAIEALSADSMYERMAVLAPEYDIIIMSAAVADYTPENPSENKIKKTSEIVLQLKRTKDILAELGHRKTSKQVLIGFAAESERLEEYAKGKLQKKNLDMIVANHLDVAGRDTTESLIISAENTTPFTGKKLNLANEILTQALTLYRKNNA